MTKHIFKKNIIILILLFTLIIFGSLKLKLLNFKTIIVEKTYENTGPDFKVIFGKSRLVATKYKTKKTVDNNYVWVKNKEMYFKTRPSDFENNNYFYFITGTTIGYDSEVYNSKIINPKFKIESIYYLNKKLFWAYLTITFLTIMLTLRNLIKTV